MDFAESAEHQMLRKAVAGVAAQFGHSYYLERAKTGQSTTELWNAVAEHGFLAVHLPTEWGGGGGGITELAIVCEELAAQGCPLLLLIVSAAISAELIARFGTDRTARKMAARTRHRRKDGVRHYRTRCRLEQPQPLDDGSS